MKRAMGWRETPEDKRAYAMRYDPATETWSRCWYSDLRKGDVFRAFAFDGTQMDPIEGTEADDENLVALVTDDPVHNSKEIYPEWQTVENPNAGWAVPVITGTFPAILREVAN